MKKKKFKNLILLFISVVLINNGMQAMDASALSGTVVRRDDKGVWFIEADTVYGGFEAMGYCIAEDRLWQLEMYRRAGTGTLAEIFGSEYLQVDVFFRTIGYSRLELQEGYNRLGSTEKIMIQAYVDGINRRLNEVAQNIAWLPFEFHALGSMTGKFFIPASWSVTDIIAISVFIMRQFDAEALATGQLDNALLLQSLAAQYPLDYMAMFNDLRWLNDPLAPVMVSAGKKKKTIWGYNPGTRGYQKTKAGRDKVKDTIDAIRTRLKKINACVKMGSYAAVLAGKKTTTGNPMLYSGPQMGFETPSIACEGSIKVPGYEVSGLCVPGFPGIVIGRTPYYTWSMQVGSSHTVDYYLESPAAVFLDRMETFHIAGESTVQLPVFRTKHGPVIDPLPYDPGSSQAQVISWKYAHWEFELDVQHAMYLLGSGNSLAQFKKIIETIPFSMHICYADKKGNIAYWMSGRDPVRAPGSDPRLPQLGDGSQEWPEPVTLKQRPFGLNPKAGFFTGWNTKATADYESNMNYLPELIQGVFHRSHVAKEYFSRKKHYSFADVRNFGSYLASTDSFGLGGNPWQFASTLFTRAVLRNPTPDRMAALRLLKSWDGFAYRGGPGAIASSAERAEGWVLQNNWITEVLRLIFEDELSTGNMQWNEQPLTVLFNVLLHITGKNPEGLPVQYESWLLDKAGSGKPSDLEKLIILGLDNTLTGLGVRPWRVPRGGIVFTHAMLGVLTTTPFAVRSTYAQCVEMGRKGPVRIESMFALGQSGNILLDFTTGAPLFDANFFSMQPYFDTFTYRAFPLFDKTCKSGR